MTYNSNIAIIDYGMGNLRSVQKAFEKVGHPAIVTSDPAVVAKAGKIVLPGVGAFEDAIAGCGTAISSGPSWRPSTPASRSWGSASAQMLFDVSYENGRHEGLGVLRGEVVRFDLPEVTPCRTWAGTRSISPSARRCWRAWTRARTSTSSTRIT